MDHLRQSIAIILTTPQGSRLERRTFGSLLPGLIDAPFNATTRLRCYAATVSAIMNWEPRLRVTRVGMEAGESAGQAVITLEGEYRPTGSKVMFSTSLQLRGAA
nr:GPW/gp25 family protein [Comamonas testosteroni]